jgi:Hydrophobic surface binding protein A
MQFLTLILLVTTSLASPLLRTFKAPQDTIGNSLDSIGSAVEKCTKVITSWNGELTGAEEIITASNAILDEMKKAAASISSLKTLNILEAVAVVGPTNGLSGKVDAVTSALLSKKESSVRSRKL